MTGNRHETRAPRRKRLFMLSATCAAMAATLTATGAQAARAVQDRPPCVNHGEARAVMRAVAPSFLVGVMARCRPVLGADSFFTTGGAAMVARYRTAAAPSLPAAATTLLRVAAPADASAQTLLRQPGLVQAMLPPMLDALFTQTMAEKLPLDACGAIDSALGMLAPLPPENMAELLLIAVERGVAHVQHRKAEQEFLPLPFAFCSTSTD